MIQRPELTAEQLDKLKRAQRDFHDILPVFDDAEKCGIDCTAFRALVADQQEVLTNLEANFKAKGLV